jgi:hypothetical protein
VLLLLALAGLLALTGCAHVKPIEREYLSSDIMQLDDDERGRSQEQHWLETLEASTGGYGGAAGGCACY